MTSWEKNYKRIFEINRKLDEMCVHKLIKQEDNITILINKFDLTYEQAKAWLEQEPNFLPIRRKETVPKSDVDETEPFSES